jgi:hypothetical protein
MLITKEWGLAWHEVKGLTNISQLQKSTAVFYYTAKLKEGTQ